MSDNGVLIYVPESTYKTTPADSANWKTIRRVTDNFAGGPDRQPGTELRADGQPLSSFQSGITVPGGFNGVLSYGTHDDFLEAVFRGTWASDVLKLGTTDRSFSVQKTWDDHVRRALYTGTRVDSLEIGYEFGQEVRMNFGMAAAGVTMPDVSAVGSGSVAAASTSNVMNGNDVGTIQLAGGAIGVCVPRATINMSWNHQPRRCLGDLIASDIAATNFTCTGNIVLNMSAAALDVFETRVLDTTDAALVIPVTLGSESYTLTLPNVGFEGSVPALGEGGALQDITINLMASYDASSATTVQMVRASS